MSLTRSCLWQGQVNSAFGKVVEYTKDEAAHVLHHVTSPSPMKIINKATEVHEKVTENVENRKKTRLVALTASTV